MELIGAIIFIYCLCAFFAWLSEEIKKEEREERDRERVQAFERQTQKLHEQWMKSRQQENEMQTQSHINLMNYYRTSKEAEVLVEAICNGSRLLYIPEQIAVFDDRVESTINGVKIVCKYSDYGLQNMKTVYWGGLAEDSIHICRPQLALAGVINHKLNGIYQINDCAKKELHEHKHSYDDKVYFTMNYVSDYALLTLKGFKH